MLLELPAVIATILTPSFAAGWVSLETIAEHFGEDTASVLAAIDSLHSCIIQYKEPLIIQQPFRLATYNTLRFIFC